jgi:beta-xylosidase
VRVVAVALLIGAALVACGDDDDGAEPATTSTAPVTTGTTSTAATTTTSMATTAPASTSPPDLPTGAAYPRDFPDPAILAQGEHFAFATGSGFIQVQGLRSAELTGWRGPDEVLAELPTWAVPWSAWAPAAVEVAGEILVYYTVQVAGRDQHCISVATAASAAGPFVDRSEEPLLCPVDLGGAIDPSPFVDVDGRLHLLWKSDGVTLRRESAIWSQPLSEDGRATAGEPARLIDTDQAWEYPHVEAPSMALVDGTYWLAYSGNWFNQDAYGIGLARCDSVAGPCTKPFDGPVLASAPGRYGPGGGEFFRDRSGRLLLAYHAWLDEPGYPGHRALHVAGVSVEDGVLALDPGPG